MFGSLLLSEWSVEPKREINKNPFPRQLNYRLQLQALLVSFTNKIHQNHSRPKNRRAAVWNLLAILLLSVILLTISLHLIRRGGAQTSTAQQGSLLWKVRWRMVGSGCRDNSSRAWRADEQRARDAENVNTAVCSFCSFHPDRFERRESRDNNLVDMSIFSFIVSLRVAKRLLRVWQGRFMSLCIKSKSSFIALLWHRELSDKVLPCSVKTQYWA